MSLLHTILIVAATFLAVFWEALFSGLRSVLGAQIDLLPPLIVYASLTASVTTVSLVALCGGLWFDALSANPLGVSVLPLFAIGIAISANRDLILRDQAFAQVMLGLGASTAAPLLTLLLLLTTGRTPLLGWGSLWQLIVMAAGGAAVTPCLFVLFPWLRQTLSYSHASTPSFRPDREIRRGR